jgi:tetratricopeptide (TPR) repeat protein
MLGRKSGSGLSRSNRVRAPVGCTGASTLDWSAPALRRSPRFGALFAAAIGVAGAAFAVSPAAFAQPVGASTPAQVATHSAFAQPAGASTPTQGASPAAATQPAGASAAPTQVASPSTASLSNADKLIAADLLFKRLLLKPDDLDAGFKYAQLETELGDYEAAIGALERMLYYNPNLPRVKLQLGVLYFHLRSYEMARNYFDAVLNAPDTPSDVRTEVQTYVAAVDKAVAINQFSVYGQFGLAYQTNANAGPNSPNVLALGQNALLSPEFQKTPDWNAFGLVTVHDFYDFSDQRGDGWESDLIAYYSQQFKVTRLDLGLVELRTGPRIGIGDYGGLSVHPYAIGNVLTLGGANYLNTAGAGASLNWPVNEMLTVTPGVEFRNRWFSNSANYPTAEGQSGGQWIGYVFASGLLSAPLGLSWQGRVSYTDSTASYGPYAFHDFSIDLGMPYSFAAPSFAHTGSLWTLTPSVGFSYTPYAIPDLIVDPFTTRMDKQWRVSGTLDTNFYHNIGFTLQVQYLRTYSTVPNYSLQDFLVAAGPTFRF